MGGSMSIVLQGTTSGSITLQEPAVAGTNTLNLPAVTGTVMVNGPAFSVYRNALQNSISATTWTKVQLNTEVLDTNNNFDSTTNFRFTPTVAGYYMFTGSVASNAGSTFMGTRIYKNGVNVSQTFADNTNGYSAPSSCLIYMNGTTDYVELFGYLSSSGAFYGEANQSFTYFQGFLARGE
jgi:hypothetical protein